MKAEIIAIGTEILLGQIVNTNTQYMAQELADLGVDIYFQDVVGDNMHRVQEVLKIASERADLIVCCGGLGPTEDDLTKDAIAQFTESTLVIDPVAELKIEALFKHKEVDLELLASNKRQANIIQGSHVLTNDVGLAVGFLYLHNGTYYATLPGPPKEMQHMFDNVLAPLLDNLLDGGTGARTKLYSKYLKFGDIGESRLETRIRDIIHAQSTVSIASYANVGDVTIRLTTKASSLADAQAEFAKPTADILDRLSEHLYSTDNETLEAVLSKLTIDKFGIIEVNTDATLTHSVLSGDIGNPNHQKEQTQNLHTSRIDYQPEPITHKMAENAFAQFVKDKQLLNAIGLFYSPNSKTFHILLYTQQQISSVERTVIGDNHAVQIRATKLALFLFLKAYR